MFETNWANKEMWSKEKEHHLFTSKVNKNDIKRTMFLEWQEHCTECGAPECFKTCYFYESRLDRSCRRFVYGIYPNKNFKGLFNFGADIRFKKWGKLEADIRKLTFPVSVNQHILIQRIFKFFLILEKFSILLFKKIFLIGTPLDYFFLRADHYNRKLRNIFCYLQNTLFKKKSSDHILKNYDEFVIELFSAEKKNFKLIVEYFCNNQIKFRNSLNINPGQNYFVLPLRNFIFDLRSEYNLIKVYPENYTINRRVIFTWLDFLKYKTKKNDYKYDILEKPSEKVKCVAWDLDNTLWKGILVEDGEKKIKLNTKALKLIKKLDERGIIQTIVSKNNFNDAWRVLKKFKLQDYFIYPIINWGQKSENLKKIANKINININTFALIDDSNFERNEVQSALPYVKVYSDTHISKLLNYKEFDVPVTEISKKRRLSYLAEIKREKEKTNFSDNYEEFLRSCEMEMEIFIPKNENQMKRCWELIQRSSQLNLTAERYTEEEFENILNNKEILSIAFSCKDKFGDYGIIGFSSFSETNSKLELKDFVLSCRAAQKHIEHAFFSWLSKKAKRKGKKLISAKLIKTGKNKPLFKVFKDLNFRFIKETKDFLLVELNVNKKTPLNNIIKLRTDALKW
ncbi:MAG: HAD-IIIC family phosphatase [Fusobacteriaceae bacterium]|nr:HAD-IIIC family phosphatase [Fusobacteriaceae bacterium]